MNLTQITKAIAIGAIACTIGCLILAALEHDPTETLAWSLVVILHAKEMHFAFKKS